MIESKCYESEKKLTVKFKGYKQRTGIYGIWWLIMHTALYKGSNVDSKAILYGS